MSLLITFLQGWTVLFVLLKLVESLTHGRLSSLLSRHNIRLHYCFVSVHTTQFNTPLEAFSRRRKSFLKYWFSLGVFFGLIGLLLSVLLLLTNLSLIFFDFIAPPLPPPPPHLPVNFPPHRPTPRLHSALSLASPRAPSPRVPFLHHSQRPWFLPSIFWHNLSPRDHSAAHSLAISTRMAAAPAMFTSPTRRSHPSGFFDYPPPPLHGRRHHHPRPRRLMAHRGRIRGMHRPPCKNRHRAQTPWNRFQRPLPPQALPPPALPGPDQRPAIADGRRPEALAKADDEKEEADLIANGEKTSITMSWRTRNLLSLHEADPELSRASRFRAESQNESDSTTTGASSSKSQQDSGSPQRTFLTPLLPGITVPAGDIWYMIVAVLAAAVIHELGHALAAGMQNAKVSGIGGFIALLIPGAYVQLEGIDGLSPFRQLKVYCAGPWHNVVSAILALIVAGWLPAIMGGLYACEQGAMVVSLPELSPLHGHVEPGDIIVRLGKFKVGDGGPSFRMAISRLISTEDSVGFCVPEELYRNHSKPRSPCCTREYLDNMEAGEGLRHKCFRVEGIANRTSCLDLVAVSRQGRCRQTSECNGGEVRGTLGRVVGRDKEGEGEMESSNRAYAGVGASAGVGDDGDTEDTEAEAEARAGAGADEAKAEGGLKRREKTSCFIPVLPMRQQLVDIEVRSGRTGEAVIFFYEGFPPALGQSVTVSSYVPRAWAYGPGAVVRAVARLDVPNAAERLLQYFASISLGLGVLNMAPVVYLDGEMSSALFMSVLAPKMGRVVGNRVRSLVVFVGTVLLVVNMVVALLEMEEEGAQGLQI